MDKIGLEIESVDWMVSAENGKESASFNPILTVKKKEKKFLFEGNKKLRITVGLDDKKEEFEVSVKNGRFNFPEEKEGARFRWDGNMLYDKDWEPVLTLRYPAG